MHVLIWLWNYIKYIVVVVVTVVVIEVYMFLFSFEITPIKYIVICFDFNLILKFTDYVVIIEASYCFLYITFLNVFSNGRINLLFFFGKIT